MSGLAGPKRRVCEPSEGRYPTGSGAAEGRGGEWGQLANAVETIPRRPVPFATCRIYDLLTLWLKYTLFANANLFFL